MNPMLSLLSGVVLGLTAVSATAQTDRLAAHNCAITIPDGWYFVTNIPPQPSGIILAGLGKNDKSRLIMISVNPPGESSGPVNDRFVRDFEAGAERSGGEPRISGRFIRISGIKSYE